ncbi:hypothetical protein Vretifemale_17506, partial [Volvox reticuliferus]
SEPDADSPLTPFPSFHKSHLHASTFIRHPRSTGETSSIPELNKELSFSTPTTIVTTATLPSPYPCSRLPSSITSNAQGYYSKTNSALHVVDGQAKMRGPTPRATATSTAAVRKLAQQPQYRRPSQPHADEIPLLDAMMRIAAARARLDAESMALEAVRTSAMEAASKDALAEVQEAKDALAHARAAVLMGADRLVAETEAARERAWRDASAAAAARAAVDDAALAGARAKAAVLAKGRLDALVETVEGAARREVLERIARSRVAAVARAEAKALGRVMEEGYENAVAVADTAAAVRREEMDKKRLGMENGLRDALAAFQDADSGRRAAAASRVSTAEAAFSTAVAAACSLREAQAQAIAAAREAAEVEVKEAESARNRARATASTLVAADARAAAATFDEAAEAAHNFKAINLEAVNKARVAAEEGLWKAKRVQSSVRAFELGQKEERSREGERKWVE